MGWILIENVYHGRMTMPPPASPASTSLPPLLRDVLLTLRTLAGVALDYLRWTQLIPMLAVWSLMLGFLLILLLISFQTQAFIWIEAAFERWPRLPELLESAANRFADQTSDADSQGALRFSGEDFRPYLYILWAGLALLFQLAGALRGWMFGHRPRPPFSHWILRTAMLAAVCSLGFFVAFLFGEVPFQGGVEAWWPMFIGLPLIAWLVSVYSLGVSYVLGSFKIAVLDAPRHGPVKPDTNLTK